MKRRDVLAVFSTVTTTSLSGCALLSNEPTTQLGGIIAANYTEREKKVRVKVFEDSVEHQFTELNLPASSDNLERRYVECTWPSESGEFVIEAETGRKNIEVDLTKEADDSTGDCVVFGITLGRFGPLSWVIRSCDDFDFSEIPDLQEEALCEGIR